MYVAVSTKSNMSFMNTTTNSQPAQKYAFRSVLLPPPQKTAAVKNSRDSRKIPIARSKSKRKVGYDQSVLFSGLTQLQKGNPVTKLQTLQTLTQLAQIQDPNYLSLIHI